MSQTEKILQYFERFSTATVLFQAVDGELFTELPDATAYATDLIDSTIVNIARPLNMPAEVLPRDGKWVFFPNGASNVLQDNLITNGFGELGGVINFSQFRQHIQNDFVELQLGANYRGEQGYLIDGKAVLMTDSLIAVTPGQMYCLEFMATTLDLLPSNFHEYDAGVMFFDADGVQIENNFLTNNTIIRLKADLKAGDTYMVLNDSPNFAHGTDSDGQRNIAFMDHTYKNGRRSSRYTRDVLYDVYSNDYVIVIVGRNGGQPEIRLILTEPWAGPTVREGTRIANVKTPGYAKIKSHGGQRSETKVHRLCFGGLDFEQSPGANFNVSRFAKYMKFFVQQTSTAYFDLLISDVSLKEIYPGEDLTPKGYYVDPNNVITPEIINPSFVPNGYKYRIGSVVYESFEGSWIQRPYTVLT